MSFHWLEDRPLVLAIAGPNGAGKSTFYLTNIAPSGLPLVNADVISKALGTNPYHGAHLAAQVRETLRAQRESFAFETVFSDPVGDKLRFLKACQAEGYTVGLLFVGLRSARMSAERVAMRVSQGGHDVPSEKLRERFPRTLANLRQSIQQLPHVVVFDNSDLNASYQRVALYENGEQIELAQPCPRWLRSVVAPPS